ncbi:MAG: hypothetical protein R2776_08375 [Flavobacteriaceae bacterium]|nr:hypothetical protein [Flavobacteriaceae bacterium]
MLGIILIYWIGRYFYQLAEKFDKNKWGFAVLGVVSYYAASFIGGIILGIIGEIISPGWIDTTSEMVLGLIALPFGILGCYGLYIYLKKSWEKRKKEEAVSIDDIGKS